MLQALTPRRQHFSFKHSTSNQHLKGPTLTSNFTFLLILYCTCAFTWLPGCYSTTCSINTTKGFGITHICIYVIFILGSYIVVRKIWTWITTVHLQIHKTQKKYTENHNDAATITRCITQQNTNLRAIWNLLHGQTHHHGSQVVENFKGYIDNSMERTFTLFSVKGDGQPRITNNTRDAANTWMRTQIIKYWMWGAVLPLRRQTHHLTPNLKALKLRTCI